MSSVPGGSLRLMWSLGTCTEAEYLILAPTLGREVPGVLAEGTEQLGQTGARPGGAAGGAEAKRSFSTQALSERTHPQQFWK